MNENTLAILLLGLSPPPQILQLLSKTLQNRAEEWMNNGVEGLRFLPPMSSLCLAMSRVRGVCVLRRPRPQLPRNVVENFAFLLSARRDLRRGERLAGLAEGEDRAEKRRWMEWEEEESYWDLEAKERKWRWSE